MASPSDNETFKYIEINEHLQTIRKKLYDNKNNIECINTWAISILTYSFEVKQRTTSDIQALDRIKIRADYICLGIKEVVA